MATPKKLNPKLRRFAALSRKRKKSTKAASASKRKPASGSKKPSSGPRTGRPSSRAGSASKGATSKGARPTSSKKSTKKSTPAARAAGTQSRPRCELGGHFVGKDVVLTKIARPGKTNLWGCDKCMERKGLVGIDSGPTNSVPAGPALPTAHVGSKGSTDMEALKKALAAHLTTTQALIAALMAVSVEVQTPGKAPPPPPAGAKPKPPPAAKKAPPPPPPPPAAETQPEGGATDPEALRALCKAYVDIYGAEGLRTVMNQFTTGTVADIPPDKLPEFIAAIGG